MGLLGTRRTYCLNLVRVFSAGVPMTSWIFEIWSSSLAPGKRGCRLEEQDRTVVRGGHGLFIPASPSAGRLAHMETQGHNPTHGPPCSYGLSVLPSAQACFSFPNRWVSF